MYKSLNRPDHILGMTGGTSTWRLFLLGFLLTSLRIVRSQDIYLHASHTIETYCSSSNASKELTCDFFELDPDFTVKIVPHARTYDSVSISNASSVDLSRTEFTNNLSLSQIGFLKIQKPILTTNGTGNNLFQLLSLNSSTVGDVELGELKQLSIKNSTVTSIEGIFKDELDILGNSHVDFISVSVGGSRSSFKNSFIGEIRQLSLNGGSFNCENMMIDTIKFLNYSGGKKEVRMKNTTVTTINPGSMVLGVSTSDIFLMDGLHISHIADEGIKVNGALEINNSIIEETYGKGIILENGASLLLRDVNINNFNLSNKITAVGKDPLFPLMLCLHDHYNFYAFLIALAVISLLFLLIIVILSIFLHRKASNKNYVTNVDVLEMGDRNSGKECAPKCDSVPNFYSGTNQGTKSNIHSTGKFDGTNEDPESPTAKSLLEKDSQSAKEVDFNYDDTVETANLNTNSSQNSNFPLEIKTGNMMTPPPIPEESTNLETHTDEEEYGQIEDFTLGSIKANKSENHNIEENTIYSTRLQKNIPSLPTKPPKPPIRSTAPQKIPNDQEDYEDVSDTVASTTHIDDEPIYDDTNDESQEASFLHSNSTSIVSRPEKPAKPNFVNPYASNRGNSSNVPAVNKDPQLPKIGQKSPFRPPPPPPTRRS